MAKRSDSEKGHQVAEDVIPVLEETARAKAREVSKGRVRVRTETDAIEEVIETTIREDGVEITRVPVDQVVTEIPAVRTKDGVTIIPVLEEVVTIQTQLVLKEEIHIHRSVETKAVKVPVRLRKQRAVVERITPEAEPNKE